MGECRSRDETEFVRLGGGLTAVVHAQFAIDVLEVSLDGVDRHTQDLRDLLVALAADEQAQDVEFALAQRLDEWLGGDVRGGRRRVERC